MHWIESHDPKWWLGDPIWNTVKSQNKTSAVLFWPGSDCEIAGSRPDFWYDYDLAYTEDFTFDKRVDVLLNWVDGVDPNNPEQKLENPPDLIMSYFNQPDSDGHSYGPNSDEIGESVAMVDQVMGSLIEGLIERNLFNCINLIIVADHGMAATSNSKEIHLADFVDETQINLDSDVYVLQGASSGLKEGFGPENLEKYQTSYREALYDSLHCQLEGDRSIVLKNTANSFPKRLHYQKPNGRINDLIFLTENDLTVGKRFDPNYTGLAGNHGYDNEYQSMHALFLATGNAFYDSFEDSYIHQNVELYNVISNILHVKASPNNGTVSSLNHILNDNFKMSAVEFSVDPDISIFEPIEFKVTHDWQALENFELPAGIFSTLREFYTELYQNYFKQFLNPEIIDDTISVKIGPIYDHNLDGKADTDVDLKTTTPTQMYVILTKNNLSSTQDIRSFILPNWEMGEDIPCDFNPNNEIWMQRTLELYYATIRDVENLAGREFFVDLKETDPFLINKKLFLPEFDSDFWPRYSA